MKTIKSLFAFALIAIIPFAYTACDESVDESCEQQDMNEVMDCGVEKNVEVCCTEGADCVYKFNGQEYPDTSTGLNNLADALGCTYKSSPEYQAQKEVIIENLVALKDKALTAF